MIEIFILVIIENFTVIEIDNTYKVLIFYYQMLIIIDVYVCGIFYMSTVISWSLYNKNN